MKRASRCAAHISQTFSQCLLTDDFAHSTSVSYSLLQFRTSFRDSHLLSRLRQSSFFSSQQQVLFSQIYLLPLRKPDPLKRKARRAVFLLRGRVSLDTEGWHTCWSKNPCILMGFVLSTVQKSCRMWLLLFRNLCWLTQSLFKQKVSRFERSNTNWDLHTPYCHKRTQMAVHLLISKHFPPLVFYLSSPSESITEAQYI